MEDPAEIETAVRQILPGVEQLSDRLDLLSLVGYREGAGHKLISEEAATELETELRRQVRAATASDLSRERDLLQLLAWTRRTAGPSEDALEVPLEVGEYAALLKSSITEVQRQSFDSRVVSRHKRLFWSSLVELVGGDEHIEEIVPSLAEMSSEDAELAEAVELAKRYLSGWQPDRYDDE